MALSFAWTGRNELERVARIRWECFGSRDSDYSGFIDKTRRNRFQDGDVCIASDGGRDIGTATALSMRMHLRGRCHACQGVAWVGTSKTRRRRTQGERGVASQVLGQILRKARERDQVVTALMPFRVSFYEHFGYGLVEHLHHWTIPLASLQAGDEGDWRYGSAADLPAMVQCRRRQAQHGACDVETDPAAMNEWLDKSGDCQLLVDDRGDRLATYTWIRSSYENGRAIAQVVQPAWDSSGSLKSLLGLLGSLRDQYAFARIALPSDLPLNLILRESHMHLQPTEQVSAACAIGSRMQARVIDHVRFMSGQHLPRPVHASVCVEVIESEGERCRFEVDLGSGVVEAKRSSRSADVTVSDRLWAQIATGAVRASMAQRLGLLDAATDGAVQALEVFSEGPAPYCAEYF